ncbi:MAG: hypothetical protein HFG40_04640 [Bacilli bacterium]|nr:hypothetical protein [Bacilli bacterium]
MNNQNVGTPFVDETFAKIASDYGMSMRQLENKFLEEDTNMAAAVDPNLETRKAQVFDLKQEAESRTLPLDVSSFSDQELQIIYDRSIQDGKKEQLVRGELYVGKNSSLLKFTSKIKDYIIPKLQRTFERIRYSSISTDDSTKQAEIISLKPASIFDDELLGPSEMGQLDNEYQNRGSK